MSNCLAMENQFRNDQIDVGEGVQVSGWVVFALSLFSVFSLIFFFFFFRLFIVLEMKALTSPTPLQHMS